jgi:hypothetical protein
MHQDDSVTSSNLISKVSHREDETSMGEPPVVRWSVLPSGPSTRPTLIEQISMSRLDGEVISSWVYRVSVRYSMSTCDVARELKLSGNPHTMDFSGLHAQGTRRAYVTAQNAVANTDSVQNKGLSSNPQRLIELTMYRTRAPIYRFCPLCLAEDSIPYIRWQWRLVSTVCCERHKIVLHERCSKCGVQVDLGFNPYFGISEEKRDRAMLYCRECQTMLSDACSLPVPDDLLHRLQLFARLVCAVINDRKYRPRCLLPIELPESPLEPFLWTEWCQDEEMSHGASFSLLRCRERVDWETVVGPPHYGRFLNWIDGQLEIS